MSELAGFRLVERVQKGVWESLGDYDLRGALRRLEVPAVVLHGKDDVIPWETAEETAEYWHTRPRGSRLGAWASRQSQPIESRAALEQAMIEVGERYGVDEDIPVPPFWGGLRIVPESVEFWQGRPNRLHNRVLTRLVDGQWSTVRLQP